MPVLRFLSLFILYSASDDSHLRKLPKARRSSDRDVKGWTHKSHRGGNPYSTSTSLIGMSKKETKELDLAKGFDELETLTAWFERGEADIDEGLEKFERAMTIVDALQKRLSIAENKVRDIKKKFKLDETL